MIISMKKDKMQKSKFHLIFDDDCIDMFAQIHDDDRALDDDGDDNDDDDDDDDRR